MMNVSLWEKTMAATAFACSIGCGGDGEDTLTSGPQTCAVSITGDEASGLPAMEWELESDFRHDPGAVNVPRP